MAEETPQSIVLPKIKDFLDGKVKPVVKKGVDFTRIIQQLRANKRNKEKKG